MEAIENAKETLHDLDIAKESQRTRGVKHVLRHAEATERDVPIEAIPGITRSTFNRIKGEMGLEHVGHGTQQNLSRRRALMEIANPISLGAAVANLVGCPEQTLTNTDEVTKALGHRMGETAPLWLMAGSRKDLADRGLMPAETVQKDVALNVPHVITTNASGHLVHAAIIIHHEKLSDIQHYPIGDSLALSLWMVPVGCRKALLFKQIQESFIVPAINRQRQLLSGAGLGSGFSQPTSSSGSLVGSSTLPHPSDDAAVSVDVTSIRAAQLFDGDFDQIDAVLEEMGLLDLFKSNKLEIVKLGAACSFLQAPADLATAHRTLHQAEASEMGHPSASMSAFISQVLQPSSIPAAPKKLLEKYLSNVEDILTKAFNPQAVREGWRKSGIHPFSLFQIFTGYAGWTKLDKTLQTTILGAMPHFQEHSLQHGRISDSYIRDHLTQLGVDCSLFEWRKEKLEERRVSCQRVIWLCNDDFLAQLKLKAEGKLATIHAADAKRAARELKSQTKHKSKKAKLDTSLSEPSETATAAAAHQSSTSQETADQPKKYVCGHSLCQKPFDETSSTKGKWLACEYCDSDVWYCTRKTCRAVLSAHETKCKSAATD